MFRCCIESAERALASSLQGLESFARAGLELQRALLVGPAGLLLVLSKFPGWGLELGPKLGLQWGLMWLLGLVLQEWVGEGLSFAFVPENFDSRMEVSDQMKKRWVLEHLLTV